MTPNWLVFLMAHGEVILAVVALIIFLVVLYGLSRLVGKRPCGRYTYGRIGNLNTARQERRTGDLEQLIVTRHGLEWIPADGWEKTFKEGL